MLAPSNTGATGPLPVAKVPWFEASLARSFVTVLSWKFVTQMYAPSKAQPRGWLPTTGVLVNTPVLIGILETLPPLKLVAQRFNPSKQTAIGCPPLAVGAVNPISVAWYQWRVAI